MAASGSAKSGCVDENTLLDFLSGRLEGGALEAVERHMDECADCRMLLAYASTRSGMRTNHGTLEAEFARSIPRVGQRVGDRFLLDRLLGWGAMGVVFEAYDEHLEVQVAIKLLHVALADRAPLHTHLRREILVGRKIRHPNVCRVHDFGMSDGNAFISMELVRGLTLADYAKPGLAPVEAARILERVCSALTAAHLEGVVHRDLKPTNIMIDDQGRVVVMDFGLARDLSSTQSQESGLVGTPAYWAPEQIRGGAATPGSDMYALGIIAFQLFTGKPPQALVEPGAMSDVPYEYRSLVKRCLRSAPSKRPTPRRLRELLDRAHRVRNFWPRVLLAVAALAILIGGAAWLFRSREPAHSTASSAPAATTAAPSVATPEIAMPPAATPAPSAAAAPSSSMAIPSARSGSRPVLAEPRVRAPAASASAPPPAPPKPPPAVPGDIPIFE